MNRKFKKISSKQITKDFGLPDEQIGVLMRNVIKLPQRATELSAGYDFYAPYDLTIKPNETRKIPTGIKVYMAKDEVLYVHPRSSMGFKHGIRLINQTGIIDGDYVDNESNEGHIWIGLQNISDKDWNVKYGEGIAQGIFHKFLIVENDTPKEQKRVGGFGSTNK